jgi:hypothetical protein
MRQSLNLSIATLLLLSATFSYARTSSGNFAPPPVFWNVFEATAVKNNVTLTWVVTEYNNKNFYIQHSTNGNDWKDIDSIDSKKSPLTLDEYHFTHINKLNGRQYYRVKQVDIDVKNTGYSKVVSVVLRSENSDVIKPSISFSPNPATDQVRIVSNGENNDNVYTGAKIYDLSGKLVADKILQNQTNIIILTDLPIGIYIARIECSNGKIFTQKIIKQ